jgi:hypothetical protein
VQFTYKVRRAGKSDGRPGKFKLTVLHGSFSGVDGRVPVILLGKLAARKIPFKAVRIVAAGLFAVLAVLTLLASSDVANRGRRSREALSV